MLQDFEHGRKTEIEALNGALVERAWELDTDAPFNEMLTCLVRGVERGRGLRLPEEEPAGRA